MATSARRGRFQIYRSELKGYTWSLVDPDEQVVAHAPTYYASPADCLDAIERVKRFAGTAGLEEVSPERIR